MRLLSSTLPVAAALVLAAAATSSTHTRREPKAAYVVAACTPRGNPRVDPPSMAMRKVDHAVWGSKSPNAVSWTIAPKDTLDWPWAQRTFEGHDSVNATTPPPDSSAVVGHHYQYMVTVTCKDGTSQIIDPEIIISAGE